MNDLARPGADGGRAAFRAGAEALRLGYVIDSLATGGAERLIVTFAEAVRDRADVDLTVFVLNDRRTPFLEELEAMGTRVVLLPGRGIGDARRFARLLRALRRARVEYLHAHLTSATVLGSAAAALLRIPFATTIHNVRPSTRRVTALRRKVYRAALRRRGVLRIAVGRAVAESLDAEIGDRPCLVVPNAIAPSAVAPPGSAARARAALDLKDGDVVVAAVGLLIPQKGYPDLIEAFHAVAERHPEAVLLIAGASGQPDHAAMLRDKARRLGLDGRLRFLGLHRDVPGLLAASDLFASASHWEGAPIALLEALANGLPCCVTDVGENALILKGVDAAVVPAGVPDRLAAAVCDMIADPARRARASAAGRARAVEHYGAAAWADRLLALYAGHRRAARPPAAGETAEWPA